MSGSDKYVTEAMQSKEEEHRASGRLVAKARPLKPAVTLSSVSVPVRDPKWKDIEKQRSHDQQCYQVSTAMTRLAVLFDDVLEECRKKKFDGASQWSLNEWISILAKGGGAKKRIHCFLNPNSSSHFLYLKASQGHSGDNAIDPELQDNKRLPEGFTEYIYHIGNASGINSIIRSGLMLGV